MITKATFYTKTITKNDYQEEIETWSEDFSTGVEIRTVSFKDKISNGQNISDRSFYLYARKSAKTLGVSTGDKVSVQGNDFEVQGIDPLFEDRSKLIFFLDEWKG